MAGPLLVLPVSARSLGGAVYATTLNWGSVAPSDLCAWTAVPSPSSRPHGGRPAQALRSLRSNSRRAKKRLRRGSRCHSIDCGDVRCLINALSQAVRQLTVRGSCGARPEAGRACSGFLVECDGFRLVLDLGFATHPRLLALCPDRNVDAVVISHGHPTARPHRRLAATS
jgi:hypothetical protein